MEEGPTYNFALLDHFRGGIEGPRLALGVDHCPLAALDLRCIALAALDLRCIALTIGMLINGFWHALTLHLRRLTRDLDGDPTLS